MRRLFSVLALLAVCVAIPLVRQYKAAHAVPAETVDVDEGTAAERAAKRAAYRADVAQERGLVAKASPRADGATVGGFETRFATRSPFSDPATLARRLRITATPEAYDLASVGALAYVPESYDAKRPMGLVVLLNYKHSDGLPTPILPQLAAANVALVVPRFDKEPWTTRAGVALDAVASVSRRYAIDPRRTYVFSFQTERDADGRWPRTGVALGLCFPDVFSGVLSQDFGMYRRVRLPDGRSYDADLPAVDPTPLAAARGHPFVLVAPARDAYHDAIADAFVVDGFRHVLYRTLTLEQFHYPNYTTDWLPDVLKFMEKATATLAPSGPAASTRPPP